MKHLFIAISLLLAAFMLPAQEVSEAARPFIKKEQGNSLSIVLMGQPHNVEDVLEAKMREKTGQRTKGRSGLRLIEGARYDEISATSMDLYYRVEKASKRDNTHSRVTLFLSTGNNNFITSDEFPDEVAAATVMLEGLEMEVKIYEMGLLIKEQGKLIQKEEKSFDRMVQDSVNLQQQLADIEQRIEENHDARLNQAEKIVQEKDRLEEFKMKLMDLEAEQVEQVESAARLSKEGAEEGIREAAGDSFEEADGNR